MINYATCPEMQRDGSYSVCKACSIRITCPKGRILKREDPVDHPEHYGGSDNPYEAIKVIEALDLGSGFCIGNAIKYIMRAGKKDPDKEIEDLKKARWYLDRRICELKEVRKCNT